RDAGKDFRRIRADHASGNGDYGFGFTLGDSAHSKSSRDSAKCAASNRGLFIVAAELGDAADDNGVDAQHLSDFRGGSGVGAVAVGEVLFGHHLVEHLALDHGKGAVGDQLIHQQVGDALADVLIGAEHRRDAALHRRVVEVHYRYASLFSLGRGGGA